jgi:hypothetical protein
MKVKYFNQIIKNGIRLLAISLVIGACQYKEVVEVTYPAELVYLPAAVGGFYDVSTVPVVSGAARYSVDLGAKKLNIPLAIVRSGANNNTAFSAKITANTDTLGLLIAANKLVAEALPTANYTLPTSVDVRTARVYTTQLLRMAQVFSP